MTNDELKIAIHNLLQNSIYYLALVIPGPEDVLEGNASIEAIKYVLTQAACDIEDGTPLKGAMKTYISNALREIANHADPATAFKIKHGSKRRTDAGRERAIALKTHIAIEYEDMTVQQAFEKVGSMYNRSPESISKTYYKCKNEIERRVKNALVTAICNKDL